MRSSTECGTNLVVPAVLHNNIWFDTWNSTILKIPNTPFQFTNVKLFMYFILRKFFFVN